MTTQTNITLADLHARYMTELAVFNAAPHPTDEDFNRYADATWHRTEDEIERTPAQTPAAP